MTKILRIKIDVNEISFALRIENECDVMLAAGFKLATSFVLSDDLVLIFQKI
jgi:hypothetical protein